MTQTDYPITEQGAALTYRAVPSHFPPIDLFEDIEDDPANWEVLIDLESLTNDRIRQEVGDISLIPVEQRLQGPGSTPIMAAFTHVPADNMRFSCPDFGAYYAATAPEVAIHEVAYHFDRRMKASLITADMSNPSLYQEDADYRIYQSSIDGPAYDLREIPADDPCLDTEDYLPSVTFARAIRATETSTIYFPSLRKNIFGHFNICALNPLRVGNLQRPIQTKHVTIHFSGTEVKHFYDDDLKERFKIQFEPYT